MDSISFPLMMPSDLRQTATCSFFTLRRASATLDAFSDDVHVAVRLQSRRLGNNKQTAREPLNILHSHRHDRPDSLSTLPLRLRFRVTFAHP